MLLCQATQQTAIQFGFTCGKENTHFTVKSEMLLKDLYLNAVTCRTAKLVEWHTEANVFDCDER